MLIKNFHFNFIIEKNYLIQILVLNSLMCLHLKYKTDFLIYLEFILSLMSNYLNNII